MYHKTLLLREHDCGTNEGILNIEDIKDGNQIIEKIQERLIGRYPVKYMYTDPTTGEVN